MSQKVKINRYRRKITKSLTKGIGKTKTPKTGDLKNLKDVKRVLIVRANHRLGNLLLITPLLQEVLDTFPNAKVDLMIQGFLGPQLFESYDRVDHIIRLPRKPFKELGKYIKNASSVRKRKYDFAINATKGSSSGKIYTQLSRSRFKIYGSDDVDYSIEHPDAVHIAKEQIYAFRDFMNQLGFPRDQHPIKPLNINLTPAELQQGKDRLLEIVDDSKPVISIFTFATGSKCYQPDWWIPFYNRLLKEYPDYHILEILPYENVSQIDFAAPSYYSKDIREIAAFTSHTQVWIGADCGIMHLASASGAPVVGLFSRNNRQVYEPFNDGSLSLFTGDLSNDDIIEAVDGVIRS